MKQLDGRQLAASGGHYMGKLRGKRLCGRRIRYTAKMHPGPFRIPKPARAALDPRCAASFRTYSALGSHEEGPVMSRRIRVILSANQQIDPDRHMQFADEWIVRITTTRGTGSCTRPSIHRLTPDDPASFIQPEAFPNDRRIGSFRGGPADANSTRASGTPAIRGGRTISSGWTCRGRPPRRAEPARDTRPDRLRLVLHHRPGREPQGQQPAIRPRRAGGAAVHVLSSQGGLHHE